MAMTMIGKDIFLDKEFRAKMKAVGILSDECTRIKIDILAGDACKVYAYRQEGDPLVVGRKITGHEIFQSGDIRQKMIDAGILPDNCTKITIDIPADGLFKVYTETLLKEDAISVVCDIVEAIAGEDKEKK